MKVCRALTLVTAASVALAGCGGAASANGSASDSDQLSVVASFYPLTFAVEQIGGDRVRVTSMTKPGAEPHDLELLPRQVLDLQRADLVVYLPDFQPAVDAAVADHARDHAFDVSPAADLLELSDEHDHDHSDDEHADDDHTADHDEAEDHDDHASSHDGHDHGAFDPHFWLDPTRYADVARAIADELGAKDPAGAAAYQANAASLVAKLTTLDEEFRTGLATCAHREIITGHRAFGYLAHRYDLHEESVSGLTPDTEPTARSMAHVVDFVRTNNVGTVYAEALTSPALTETLARETGARIAVLDPIEGITDQSAGNDYFEVMRSNLQALRTGQDCS